jgi:hypothetical protein
VSNVRRQSATLVSALLALVVLLVGGVGEAVAVSGDPRVIARLGQEQRRLYADWVVARASFDTQQDAYWAAVSARRTERRRKMGAGIPVTAADFVMQQPPKYSGPALRPDIAKVIAEVDPPSTASEITTLPEMLAAARQHYNFAPTLIPEREFKRRYAKEALALGLTRDEVVRIYAFETGGRGTFDMQAGINPETKAGRAISTAMGYAQLLAANSIDELVRFGDGFIVRLNAMAAAPGTPPERARELKAKADVLRQMMRTGRSVPREWGRHVELARSPPGFAIHVLNLDGDVGPWLQVIKLKGIKETAEQAGRGQLSPAELELMNLAGPRTGLEMMAPAGAAAPTANFFTRAAYWRNTIVRDKTGGELLAAIDQRMNENMLRPGSVEFVVVFDEVSGRSRQIHALEKHNLLPAAARRPPAVPQPVPAERPFVTREPVAAAPSHPVPPMPVRAVRPQSAEPQPRLNWAPPRLLERHQRLEGFPD